MSRLHYIKLASPNDARRFAGYLRKPGAHMVVNAKANLHHTGASAKDGNLIGPITTTIKPHAYDPNAAQGNRAGGWVDIDHVSEVNILNAEETYRHFAAFMLVAIAVPVS